MRGSRSRAGVGRIARTTTALTAMLLLVGIVASAAGWAAPGTDADRSAQLYEHVLRETAGDRASSRVPMLLQYRQAQLCCEYPESMH
jgi:hypothetical protein